MSSPLLVASDAIRTIGGGGSKPMHHAPPLQTMDYLGPAIGAVVFVLLVSQVKEPARRTIHALLVAGAGGVYLSGGFGPWELLYPVITAPVVYLGLRSYRFIGIGWLLHAGWDLVHHLYGNAIWPFMPTSSFGCLIFDTLIALWFIGWQAARRRSPPEPSSAVSSR